MTTPSEQLSTSYEDDGHDENHDMGTTDGVTGTARREAMNVKDSALGEAQDVAQVAKEQTQAVVSDAREQAQALLHQSRDQLSDHATTQRDRAVETLRSLAGELDEMASQSTESGLGAQLAREGGQRAQQVADFLAHREPGQLLDDLRDLGRRRPGAFLMGAAVAGVLVGRISRGAMSAKKAGSSSSARSSSTTGSFPTSGTPGTPTSVNDDTTAYASSYAGVSPGVDVSPIESMGELAPPGGTSVPDSTRDGYR
jgi:hypothetical protein